jgi:hypothetical protein
LLRAIRMAVEAAVALLCPAQRDDMEKQAITRRQDVQEDRY